MTNTDLLFQTFGDFDSNDFDFDSSDFDFRIYSTVLGLWTKSATWLWRFSIKSSAMEYMISGFSSNKSH